MKRSISKTIFKSYAGIESKLEYKHQLYQLIDVITAWFAKWKLCQMKTLSNCIRGYLLVVVSLF